MIHSQNSIDTVMIAPVTVSDGDITTANIDCRNADYATIRVMIGAKEDTTNGTAMAVSLLTSDDTTASNFATIVADTAPDLDDGGSVRYEVDLRGKKRYLRLSVTAGTETGSNVVIGALASLSRNDEAPATTTALGNDVVTIVS